MQVVASLNNLRMASRKVRLVANLVKGLEVKTAQAQLRFLNKKVAGLILKLLNSGLANAKQNFNLDENNLYIQKIVVEAGPSLKRWLPRAMGRATPLLKRTCSIKLILEEKIPGAQIIEEKKKIKKTAEKIATEPNQVERAEKEEKIFTAVTDQKSPKTSRPITPGRPYQASSESKKRFFSRQTFGNIKKMFRRKSI